MSGGARIRALIVDDEPLAREGIRILLASDPEVEVIGEAASGSAALATILERSPDLVFLDVQMPEMDGFEVLAALPRASTPAIVFVTAYDRYALRAFDVHALDYLLKPFDDRRFADALARAKASLERGEIARLRERLASLGADVDGRLAIKEGGRVVFLRADEIDWIEAADYYAEIHTRGGTFLHRESMASLERRLVGEGFLRIHRSTIVNRQRIRELRGGDRSAQVVLDDGTVLRVARAQLGKIASLLAGADARA